MEPKQIKHRSKNRGRQTAHPRINNNRVLERQKVEQVATGVAGSSTYKLLYTLHLAKGGRILVLCSLILVIYPKMTPQDTKMAPRAIQVRLNGTQGHLKGSKSELVGAK